MNISPPEQSPGEPTGPPMRWNGVAAAAVALCSVLVASIGGLLLLLYDRSVGDGDGCKGWDAPVRGIGLVALGVALLLSALAVQGTDNSAWRTVKGRWIIALFFLGGAVVFAIGSQLPCHEYYRQ